MRTKATALFPLLLAVSCAVVLADDVQLSARRGASPDEVILEWNGGTAPFQVFRSDGPATVVDPSNLLGTIGDSLFSDIVPAPPGEVWFYQVSSGAFEFTHVPPCPTPVNDPFVSGQVSVAAGNCQDFEVAAYIRVPSGVPGDGAWWTKPSFDQATTPVEADCTFAFDSWTGGIDNEATAIAAYLVPIACSDSCQMGSCPPCASGDCRLPDTPEAVAFTHVARDCPDQGVLSFAGREWVVKESSVPVGPGPNIFCGGSQDVWVDPEGLHLTISDQDDDGIWCSTEVILTDSLGYGLYCIQTRGLDLPDPWMVAGMFTWDGCAAAPYREMDFEYARWGNSGDTCNAQYVVHPCFSCTGCGPDCNAHCQRVEIPDADADLTHYLGWGPGEVTFQTYRGQHCGATPPSEDLLQQWTFGGDGVPVPGAENVRFNFWLVDGHPPDGDQGDSIVITDFRFEAEN